MILVAVGYKEAAQLGYVLFNIRGIGYDQIHAQHILLREYRAAVHDDHVVLVLVYRHILADFIHTAQRYNLQF